jgi:predicted membrane protein
MEMILIHNFSESRLRKTETNPSYISVALFLAGLIIFIIDSICGGLICLFVLLGYLNFWEISWFFNVGAHWFTIAIIFVLLSSILKEIAPKKN